MTSPESPQRDLLPENSDTAGDFLEPHRPVEFDVVWSNGVHSPLILVFYPGVIVILFRPLKEELIHWLRRFS